MFESFVKIGVKFPKSDVKLPKGWNKLTKSVYNGESNFAVLTGKVNDIIVVDLDNKDSEFVAKQWFLGVFGSMPESGGVNTLVTTTINGGYHVFFKYNTLVKNIANKEFHIDVLSDNRCCYQGEHYNVIDSSVIRELTTHEVQGILSLKKTVKEGTVEKISTEYKKANELLSTPEDTEWVVTRNTKGVKAVPQCEICLLNPEKRHTHKDHSALFINKDNSVIKTCYSCGSENLTKKDSKKVVNVFNIIMNVTQDNTVYQDLVADLLQIGEQSHYKREKNTGVVYRQVKPYAYERYKEPMEYLNEIFNGDVYFKSKVNNMEDLVKFMKLYDDPEFGFLTVDKDYIGFSNGVYNKISCEFTELPPSDLVVGKYLDLEFDYTMDTPHLDLVLDYQFDTPTRDFIYMCLGRMFGIRDHLSFMLFLLGEPGTGKSVILDVLSACFDSIGSISTTFEEKFGLSFLYDKDIIICDDLPKQMSKVLNQATFQTMVSGGNIGIAVKGGNAFNVRFNVPMIFSSNVHFDYQDKGQISRRVLTAKFEKPVLRPDTGLKPKILEQELPAFIYKCTSYYKRLLDLGSSKDVWGLCPEYFLIQQDELKMERNPLFKFLKTQSVYKEGHVELLETIRVKFSEWLATPVRNLDNGTFFQVDSRYVVESMNICKHCNNQAKKGCCKTFKNIDRTKKKIVRNMGWLV
jgi:phage/plasmid-associated DNA primase